MDNHLWFVLATSAILLSAILILYRTTTRSSNSLPSGSLGWLSSAKPSNLSPVLTRNAPKASWTSVAIYAEVSKFVLQTDGKDFVPSYPKSLTELMGKSSILLINGSLQRRVHGLIGAFFKSPQLKAQITRDMHKYVQESMGNWREDHPIYIQDQAKNAKKKMVVVINKIIQAKRKSGISEVAKDVVDVLLKDESEKLTDELISDNMIDLMIPGEDSVPVLMALAVKYLSDCPPALQQLTEENLKLKKLKDQLGEPLSWRDYLSLPFTQHVITETLRMGNIIVGVMRKAMKDVLVKGYLIPKGWCVFTYFRSHHLDENFYDWPHQFNPWRWQDNEISSISFSPFGGGQRLCPGLELARLETSIFLHHFVTQFRWVAEADSIVNFPTVDFNSWTATAESISTSIWHRHRSLVSCSPSRRPHKSVAKAVATPMLLLKPTTQHPFPSRMRHPAVALPGWPSAA
ncbi:cytochrome P450, family 90, subfamily D, polypeptide 1 [Actinidia rufa]|uniref:Cytochrome P450, family 90, subfamily D, polypeptide 1 n=1 Tax=Actinidia rufa TaxID=165716 RepID=A0A7J0FZX5_9ERIC|nr:cytochrome P450, family 90, subfamily D, polypeptide 1 [Actinidia rufa]